MDNVHKSLFILMLIRWMDERKEQEEVEALREEVSKKNEINILKERKRMRRTFANQEQS